MSENIGWAQRPSVAADAKGIIGHAGAVLLRKCADRAGLTGSLSAALAVRGRAPGCDRGVVLVQLVVAIVIGATSLSEFGSSCPTYQVRTPAVVSTCAQL
ncbi:MAG: family transposase [Actinomycetia bacterium]|nr:family transposase [Actinomycetes bacterium]